MSLAILPEIWQNEIVKGFHTGDIAICRRVCKSWRVLFSGPFMKQWTRRHGIPQSYFPTYHTITFEIGISSPLYFRNGHGDYAYKYPYRLWEYWHMFYMIAFFEQMVIGKKTKSLPLDLPNARMAKKLLSIAAFYELGVQLQKEPKGFWYEYDDKDVEWIGDDRDHQEQYKARVYHRYRLIVSPTPCVNIPVIRPIYEERVVWFPEEKRERGLRRFQTQFQVWLKRENALKRE